MGTPAALSFQTFSASNAGNTFQTFKSWQNSPDPQKAQVAAVKIFLIHDDLMSQECGLNDIRQQAIFESLVQPVTILLRPEAIRRACHGHRDIDASRRPAAFLSTLLLQHDWETVQTTDVGWHDHRKLRGLSQDEGPHPSRLPGRSPYFHNGLATMSEASWTSMTIVSI